MSERTARSDRQSRCAPPLARHYEIAFLTPLGALAEETCLAPATPVFEDAFAALARGTLIATKDGLTAIEDLSPGTLVQTTDNGLQPVHWVGAMTLRPDAADLDGTDATRLTRLARESFGMGRPTPDLVLGPRARLLYKSVRCREMLGTSQAFAPAHGFVDGTSVVEVTPVAPVRLFHLALHGQQTILANGIEVESYHPGPQVETMMDHATRELFRALFPHLDSLDDFGPMLTPRLTAFELDTLRNA